MTRENKKKKEPAMESELNARLAGPQPAPQAQSGGDNKTYRINWDCPTVSELSSTNDRLMRALVGHAGGEVITSELPFKTAEGRPYILRSFRKNGKQISHLTHEVSQEEETVLQALGDSPDPLTPDQIAEATGMKFGRVYQCLTVLLKLADVEEVPGEEGQRQFIAA